MERSLDELRQQLADAREAYKALLIRGRSSHIPLARYIAAHERELDAERKLAAAAGDQYAGPLDLGFVPEAGVSAPVLLQNDYTVKADVPRKNPITERGKMLDAVALLRSVEHAVRPLPCSFHRGVEGKRRVAAVAQRQSRAPFQAGESCSKKSHCIQVRIVRGSRSGERKRICRRTILGPAYNGRREQ